MEIYVLKDGLKQGPFSLDEVRRLVKDGKLRHTDLVRFMGCDEWVMMDFLPGMSPQTEAPAPPKPAAFPDPQPLPPRTPPGSAGTSTFAKVSFIQNEPPPKYRPRLLLLQHTLTLLVAGVSLQLLFRALAWALNRPLHAEWTWTVQFFVCVMLFFVMAIQAQPRRWRHIGAVTTAAWLCSGVLFVQEDYSARHWLMSLGLLVAGMFTGGMLSYVIRRD